MTGVCFEIAGRTAVITIDRPERRNAIDAAAPAPVAHVVAILDGLHHELGEERYRVAPMLRAGLAVGAGGLEELRARIA